MYFGGSFWISVALLFIFFAGDPDIADAIINNLMTSGVVQ